MTGRGQPVERSMTFDGLVIRFDGRILEPRAWTVRQSSWAEDLLSRAPAGDVLELCSGAGHIGLRAVVHTSRRLVMVDVDPVACAFARLNADAAGMSDRVEVRQAPLESALQPTERFSLVIADPPWVPTGATGTFPDDPLLAIDGGDDGLNVARACVRTAASHLGEGGSMLIQLGFAEQAGIICNETAFDLADLAVEPGRGVVAHFTCR